MRWPSLSTKIMLVMKLTTIFLIGAFMQLSAATKAQMINYSGQSVKLEQVFDAIKKQTGYVFFYDDADISSARPVNVRLKSVNLREALSALLRDQPFTYEIQGNTVVVTARPKVLFPLVPQDKGPVKGVVMNNIGSPLADARVSVKGKNRIVFTDTHGRFIIDAADDDVLVFSYVGYSGLEMHVGKAAGMSVGESRTITGSQLTKTASGELTIMLQLNVTSLGETVVTGYQTLKKSSVAGAVSSIKADELYLNGINTIEQALQGKLAGVVITNNSGLTGTRQKTRVRGTSTLLGTQEPVWVVDGVIQEDPLPFKASTLNALGEITTDNFDYIRDFVGTSIGWLNPNDIEDITVLKDASATAIYGVRAANGVIVINTKKGKVGPATVSYSMNTSITEKVTYDRLEMMNSKERVAVSKEIYERGLISNNMNNNAGYAGALSDYLNRRITADEFERRVARLETVNSDWFDLLFRMPFSINHNLSISGGNANTRYYASIGYNSTKGTAIGNDSKGYTGNVSITSRLTNKLNVSVRLSGSQKKVSGFYLVNPYSYAARINRALEAYDESGNLSYYTNAAGFKYNFINERDNNGLHNNTLSANTSIDVNYDILPGLRFQTMFGYNTSVMEGSSYATERSAHIAGKRNYDYGTAKPTDVLYINSRLPVGGELNSDRNTVSSWNWRNSLSYSKVFAGKHALTVMGGQEASSSRTTGASGTLYGYMHTRGKSFATVPLTYTAQKTANTLYTEMQASQRNADRLTNNMGLYATVNYAYDNRYVLNASVRSDASNRFGQYTGEKFNPVWAGGLRWNAAREKWFDRSNWLADLSLRASFGYQRNIVANVSPDLIVRIPTGAQSNIVDQFTGEDMLTLSKLPYADLRWERNTSVNLGIDLSLFHGRVQTTVDYYMKKGRDLISNLNVPVEYGVETMPVNGGDMLNRGIEITASFTPVRTKDFTWNVGVNTSKNFNEIQRTGTQMINWRTATSGTYYKSGYPVSGFWAFDFTGIDPENGYPMFNTTVKEAGDSLNDPTSYMQYMGKLDPDFTAGLSMTFRYKRFSLITGLNLQVGGKRFLLPVYNTTTGKLPTEYENLPAELVNRWTPSNKTASLPGLPDYTLQSVQLPNNRTYTQYYEMYNNSSARVVDASSLQCNNLSVNYSMPEHLATRLKCRNISVGGGVSQLFSIVSRDYKGRDPEVATGQQPRTRTYTLSLSASF
ncbi:SusC/RagA family TonB-linked outer membrane protein [Chitinophaga sp. XS-30]|nr:SusC/RagA family TonB-linked outer membrane protein [Chitinophaga sp. XS-30]